MANCALSSRPLLAERTRTLGLSEAPGLPGAVPTPCLQPVTMRSPSSPAGGGLLNRAGTNTLGLSSTPLSGAGLLNQAEADTSGTRANAVPRAQELLDTLDVLMPEDEEQRKSLVMAVEELRHASPLDIRHGAGLAVVEKAAKLIEGVFEYWLQENNEKEANSALWLAGRLPSTEDEDDEDPTRETLQDRLRRRWDESRMTAALERARSLTDSAGRGGREDVEELMESLDLAQFHAQMAQCDAADDVEIILAELGPSLVRKLEQLLDSRRFDEAESLLNAIGAGRSDSLGLAGAQTRLERLRGLELLRSALTPTPGQIGFPVLKQRQLRHAVMAVGSAMADDTSGEATRAVRDLLLGDLMQKCIDCSNEAFLALLQTAFDLHMQSDDVWRAARDPFEALKGHQRDEGARGLAQACKRWHIPPPKWLCTPEQANAREALQRAVDGDDEHALQAALVKVKDVEGGREACPILFQKALKRLRDRHQLPEGWDVESMLDGVAEKKLIARHELKDSSVLKAFDDMLKQTTHPVWTRDRKGKVPKAFTAVGAVQVMNAGTWSAYARRRDEIAAECREVRCRSDDAHWEENLNGLPMTKESGSLIERLTSTPPMLKEANEIWLIHGTSHIGADAISTEDFDMARARPTGLFGAGLYMAESVSKSDEYVEGKVIDGEEVFPLLICRVTLGYIYYCDERRPDKRDLERRCLQQEWHSVIGDRKKVSGTYREYIIYDNLQVFPGYIVYYKRSY
eukprot:TRINITY_DN16136_c0_g1_i2.p1 TRINITY_DN16136_c0_g1~~TRINITY_DN16136_c0_g1_i2.p1  ORF type:complete len:854 (+),score=169.16 TRINITY_DN16136_c0_g1_i2:334-2562(+)